MKKSDENDSLSLTPVKPPLSLTPVKPPLSLTPVKPSPPTSDAFDSWCSIAGGGSRPEYMPGKFDENGRPRCRRNSAENVLDRGRTRRYAGRVVGSDDDDVIDSCRCRRLMSTDPTARGPERSTTLLTTSHLSTVIHALRFIVPMSPLAFKSHRRLLVLLNARPVKNTSLFLCFLLTIRFLHHLCLFCLCWG